MTIQQHAAWLRNRIKVGEAAAAECKKFFLKTNIPSYDIIHYQTNGIVKAAKFVLSKVSKAEFATGGRAMSKETHQERILQSLRNALRERIRTMQHPNGRIVLKRNDSPLDKEFKAQEIMFYESQLRELATIKL